MIYSEVILDLNTLPWQYSRAGCFYTPDTSGLFLGAGSCSTDMMSMPLPPLSYQAFWQSFLSSSCISGQCCCDIPVSSTWQHSWRMSSWAPLGDTRWPSMSGSVQCLMTEKSNNKTSITKKTVSPGLTQDTKQRFYHHILIKHLIGIPDIQWFIFVIVKDIFGITYGMGIYWCCWLLELTSWPPSCGHLSLHGSES